MINNEQLGEVVAGGDLLEQEDDIKDIKKKIEEAGYICDLCANFKGTGYCIEGMKEGRTECMLYTADECESCKINRGDS